MKSHRLLDEPRVWEFPALCVVSLVGLGAAVSVDGGSVYAVGWWVGAIWSNVAARVVLWGRRP